MTDGLTPQQLAALRTLAESGDLLLDMAARAAERRSRVGTTDGVVRKTNWTPEEARIQGARTTMRSVLRSHARAEVALAHAQEQFERTAADVLMVRAKLDALMAELGIEGV